MARVRQTGPITIELKPHSKNALGNGAGTPVEVAAPRVVEVDLRSAASSWWAMVWPG
jgi:hypothetical protein